ncbi:hypothetical protein [Acholeplasma granularum]|uniref:hypothetical protein n=1 Tax=Acholeplasma granularum TaxID=264635 RepID=UPI00046F0428|nr:hypothetical protein [Acholeplasma granularum]
MKKVLSVVTVALLFLLVSCTSTPQSNARAYITSITERSIEASFRVEVKDPDKELDTRDFKVRIQKQGEDYKEQLVSLDQGQVKTVSFEGLSNETKYHITVLGTKNNKDIELYFKENAITTKKQGDYKNDPIPVTTKEEFTKMDYQKHYVLKNDIDFQDSSITPLFNSGSPFRGSFDGGNFTLKNIKLTNENDVYKSYLSIFGYVSNATIENLKVDNIHIDNVEKPYIGIHYVSILVSKVANNDFVMNNVEISNSSIKVVHNLNQSTTNRNLYVGLAGASVQGTFSNITINNSKIDVTQNGVNGTATGEQQATTGTYIGGALGLVEQDKGKGIEKITVTDTEINLNVDQDKQALSKGLVYVGGIFGSYRSDRNTQELVTNASITINHNKHEETPDEKLDTLYVGGIAGSMIKSRLNNVVYSGNIILSVSDTLNRVYASLISGTATTSSTKLLASGTILLTTTNGTQNASTFEIYPYTWVNKLLEVKVLSTAQITIDSNVIDLSNYEVITNVNDLIDSQFVISNYKAN